MKADASSTEDQQRPVPEFAVWSLGAGVFTVLLVFCFPLYYLIPFVSLAAVLFGVWALKEIWWAKGEWKGIGIAVTGILLGASPFLLLAALFLLNAVGVDLHGKPPMVMNNGRNLYVSIYAAGLERSGDPFDLWPREGEFETSTEYLRFVVTNGIMKVDYSFFGWPKGPKGTSFRAENNAWCVVANNDERLPDGVPLLFTRNINVTNLNQLTGLIEETFTDDEPFGKKGAVMVINGGAAIVVRPEGTWEERLRGAPFGDSPVLRP